jgi:hypothetical protein
MSIADLPDGTQQHMNFLASMWFKTHGRTQPLPSPDSARALARPPYPVIFEDLGLIVKHRVDVTTTEAVALWTIKSLLKDEVPVPKVYDWRIVERDGEDCEVFLYMQFIRRAYARPNVEFAVFR